MPADRNNVCLKTAPDKSDVSAALAISWARASAGRKGEMADRMGSCVKTIDRALTGRSLPELHTALASMLVDDGALDEVFALYGRGRPPRLNSEAANDLSTVSDLSGLVAAFCDAIKDGNRDHRETLAIADLVRAIMPALTDILDEANRIRGVKAA